MAKLRLSKALVDKARSVFNARKSVYTNEGLTREELRLLRNHGLVESRQTDGNRGVKIIWAAGTLLWLDATREQIRRA